jgi:hypothetical protein
MSSATVVETPAVTATPVMANELDVLLAVLKFGDSVTLRALTAAAMVKLSGAPVDDALVDEYVEAMQTYVEFLRETVSSKRIPYPSVR